MVQGGPDVRNERSAEAPPEAARAPHEHRWGRRRPPLPSKALLSSLGLVSPQPLPQEKHGPASDKRRSEKRSESPSSGAPLGIVEEGVRAVPSSTGWAAGAAACAIARILALQPQMPRHR